MGGARNSGTAWGSGREKKAWSEWDDSFRMFCCKEAGHELAVLGYREGFFLFAMREMAFLLANVKDPVENEMLMDKEGEVVGGIFLSRWEGIRSGT